MSVSAVSPATPRSRALASVGSKAESAITTVKKSPALYAAGMGALFAVMNPLVLSNVAQNPSSMARLWATDGTAFSNATLNAISQNPSLGSKILHGAIPSFLGMFGGYYGGANLAQKFKNPGKWKTFGVGILAGIIGQWLISEVWNRIFKPT